MSAALETEVEAAIGPYAIAGVLGQGGMGIVYRAVHRETRQAVALKTAYVKDADLFACMRREIHALGRLRHPGVVRIIEEGVESGVPWYAMDLLDEAESLQAILSSDSDDETTARHSMLAAAGSGALPASAAGIRDLAGEAPAAPRIGKPRARADLPRLLTLMYRLCRVLGHIHSRGIVHRDLKPANVLVTAGDRPVLVDFGLMGRFGAGSSREVLEVGGRMMGTLAYVSPEQANGQLVDARTDLYAFGVMLYEAITGRLPFETASTGRLMHQLFFEKPEPPSRWVDGLPPILDHLVLQLMEKKPRDRYGYADDVAALLVEAGAVPEPDAEDDQPSYLYRPELEGRTTTIATLRERLDPAIAGHGALVAIGGVSGIGKTSVATAFSREATRKKMLVITGECVPVTADGEIGGEPLHPLRPLLHAIADHCVQLGPAEFDRVIGARIAVLKEYDPSLAALAHARGEEGLQIGAQAVRRRLFPDLAETLAAFTADQPLLLILDDLQWADEVTLRFLASLRPEFLANAKLMILGLYRSDEVGPELSDLLAASHLTKIELERLDDGSVAAIVKSMLASSEPSETFLQFIARQSEGSPFFVAEYLRAAVDERLLYREGGKWRLRQGDGDIAWAKLGRPGSLIELVGHRLAGLSDSTRRVAEMAAVLGRDFDERLLTAAAGGSESGSMEAISDLVARQILEAGPNGLRFVHDKLREVLHQKLTAERRATLHRAAAIAIEEHFATADALRPHAAELANHWEVAGEIEKAIRYYEMAGQQALRNGAGREASDYLLRVIALDEGGALTFERRVRRARWYRLLSAARWTLSDLAGATEHARHVLELAGTPLPKSKAGWMRMILARTAEQTLHLTLPRALYRGRRTRWPLLGEAANAAELISESAYYSEDVVTTVGAGLLAVNLAERLGGDQNVGRAYSFLAVIANFSGLKGLALRYFRTGHRIAEQAGDVDGLMHIAYSSSIYYCGLAQFAQAKAAADEAIDLARRVGDQQELELAETIAGFHEYYSGAIDKSARTYAGIRDSARKRSNIQHEAWGHLGVARAALMQARFDEAQVALDATRRLHELQPDHVSEIVCQAHLTTLHRLRGDLDLAAETADLTYAMAAASPPVMYEMFRGFAAPTEVYLEVWRRARGKDALIEARMRKTVAALGKHLHSTASKFPLLWPFAYRLSGIAACLEGDLRRGRKLIEKAAATAAKAGMPVDEAMAELDLLRNADLDPLERAAHRERARTLFRNSGCTTYLQIMRETTPVPIRNEEATDASTAIR